MAVKDVIFDTKLKFESRNSQLDRLKKELDDVNKTLNTAEQKSEKYRKAQFRLKEINNELSNSFSNTEKRVDSFGGKLSKLGNLAGIAGGAIVLQQFGRAAFTAVADFDQAMANLSAITGAVGEDLEFFEEQAKKIGSTTSLSATQAAQAFELIGSAKPELLKNKEALAQVTQEAVSLAEAAGLDLPVAAQALAGTLNQFSLAGDQSSRVINALAAGAKEGASAIPLTSQSIDRFGTVADEANISLETSVGLVQLLAEKNIKGAESGTQLRNIILKLQAANIGYVDGQFNINAALDELATKNLTAAESAKLFGLENVVAGNILVENREKLQVYTEAVTDTNIAYEQQETRTNTVKGALDRLKSAYEGVLLTISNNSGIIQSIIDRFARFLGSIKDLIEGTEDYQRVTKETTKSTRDFIDRGNELVGTYQELSSKTSLTADEKERLDRTTQDLITQFGDSVAAIDKETGALRVNIKEVIRQIQVRQALQTDRVKDLLAEKLAVETQIELADTAIERLNTLQSQYKSSTNGVFQYIEALKAGEDPTLAFANTIGKTGAVLDDNARAAIDAANQIQQPLRFQGVNLARLDEINEALANSGINLEELAKLETGDLNLDLTGGSGSGVSDVLEGSLEDLQNKLAKARKELETAVRVSGDNLTESDRELLNQKIVALVDAEEKLQAARNRIEGRPDNRLEELAEEERFYIAKLKIAGASEEDILVQQQFYAERRKLILEAQQKDQKLEYQKLTNDIELLERKQLEARKKILQEKETEEQRHQLALLDIHGATELAKLKLTRQFEDERLKTLEEGTLEYIKQQNKVAELDAKIAATRKEETRSALNDLVAASQNAAQVITDAQIAAVDAQVNAQQSRIVQARELADKGNADILEAEEKRLDQLQRKREQFVRAQQALAAAELIANSLVAVSKAAAEGGAAAPITIAATLIALAAGLVGARQAAQNAVSFREGGRAEWSKLTGYTGSGNPNTKSTTLGEKPYDYEYEEYIFPKEVVEKGNNRKWFEKIRKGRIDLDKLPMASLRGKHSITPAFNQMIERSIQMNVQMKGGGSSPELLSEVKKLNTRMESLENSVKNQPSASINVTEKGIEHIVETADFKKTRMKKIR